MNNSSMTVVGSRPQCTFCSKEAKYDARIPMFGHWANVCEDHFDHFECKLGLGNGQLLVLRSVFKDAEN